MSELDEFWSENLSDAIEQARGSGRSHVADFLELKAANDAMRQSALSELFDTFIELATAAEHTHRQIIVERESPHNFQHRGANMAGSLLRLRQGVRCLTIEAGWTRTPTDGFMRLGAFAFARFTHFGLPALNAELILRKTHAGQVWTTVRDETPTDDFGPENAREHLIAFIGTP